MSRHIRPAPGPYGTPGRGGLMNRLRRSRRGAVAVGFGVTVIAFLGLAGLATEAGYWYAAFRNGQNAADAASMGGARTKFDGWPADVSKVAGQDTAKQNGLVSSNTGICPTTGSIRVCINNPPASGAYTADNDAFEAIVTQVQTVTFGRMFAINTMSVVNRAVAAIKNTGIACVLSLSDTLNITGNFTATAPDCMFASNYRNANSISIGGSSTVNVKSLHASGGCNGCSSNNVTPGTPYVSWGSDVTNPFAALDSVSWPAFNGSGGCQSYPANGTTLQPYESNGNKAYCSDLHLPNASDGYVLVPGTYVFYNTGISINNGYLRCPTCNAATGSGVSIVLLGNGNQVGDLDINASATVTLNAGTNTTALNANLAGVLFYRENAQNDLGGPIEIHINGGATSNLQGGFYFPQADATYNGNSNSSCTVVVGGAITMNGTATFSTAGCAPMGTQTSQVRSVALVE